MKGPGRCRVLLCDAPHPQSRQCGACQARLQIRSHQRLVGTTISRVARLRIGLTVQSSVSTLSSLTLPQWLEEFERLRKVNLEIMRGRKGATETPLGVDGRVPAINRNSKPDAVHHPFLVL